MTQKEFLNKFTEKTGTDLPYYKLEYLNKINIVNPGKYKHTNLRDYTEKDLKAAIEFYKIRKKI